jgi:alginate O-acetyltransferase complex protein AlgI
MTPFARLLLATGGGIFALKGVALATRRRAGVSFGLAAFLFAWPGVIPDRFATRRRGEVIDAGRFLAAWARLFVGVLSVLLLSIFADRIPESVLGLAGVAALLLTIHLGICDLLPWLLRWAGFHVPLLFDRPWRSRSLAEFWSRRWNLAFVEMNQRLFLRAAHRHLGARAARFALFALSGVLHEVALSFPAGGGWGGPLGYFLLQGALVAIEERLRIASRVWTWFWLIAPAPWLFHEPFRRTLIVPFLRWLHDGIARNSYTWYLSHALYAAAIGHLIVLIASAQVPGRLGWKEDLAKLARFNQKVFWVYGFYIVLCIVSFAILTWRLHDAFLAGDMSARWLAGFIAVFWTIRVVVDVFWFDYRDWPPGNALIAGHAMVTSLFSVLAAVYWCAAVS